MAINYVGSKVSQTELEEIVAELYQDSATFRENVIDVQEGHKSGTDVYESKVTVAMSAANRGQVTATGNISLGVSKSPVTLTTFNFEDVIDDSALLGTRFEKSMSAGAFNNVSDEFDRKVLIQVTPAIGATLEKTIWDGATTATKAAIAALTPGAGQGSISAGAQALVAAMPTTLFDSITATIIYNNSQAKTTPGAGLGDYLKVAGTTVTKSNIAAEYDKIYAGSDSKVINDMTYPAVIFAPIGDRQLIKSANNAVGAAQQVNFLVEGSGVTEKISYNGIEIKFVPIVGFRILTQPKFLKVLMDTLSDVTGLIVEKEANASQRRILKNIQTMATWVTNQRYITLYNG